jgi:non-canonical purine NTP pyrophosphatase (RdgB/HAM1 family)
MEQITFITGNPTKAEQLSRHLNIPVAHKKLDLPEIQSLDPRQIVEHKAKEAYKQVYTPVLVEDTSLTFSALGKLPGPLIKWFLQELNNDGLCNLLQAEMDRSARASVLFGYYDGKNFEVFDGEILGSIANIPRGEKGFGWDPIFIPEGYTKTWGEMNMEEQDTTSMRRIALRKLENFLKSH